MKEHPGAYPGISHLFGERFFGPPGFAASLIGFFLLPITAASATHGFGYFYPMLLLVFAQAMNVDLEELSGLEALLEPHVPLDKATHALASYGTGEGPSGTSAVEDKIARSQMAKALAEGFKTLPERLQVVMGLHYVEGLTYREIAKMLDVSEPRVCQLHADALKRLRAAMPDFNASDDRA